MYMSRGKRERVAAIARRFCLCLPSCGPGFESQAHHLRYFQFLLLKLYRENNKNKQKEARIGPFYKRERERGTQISRWKFKGKHFEKGNTEIKGETEKEREKMWRRKREMKKIANASYIKRRGEKVRKWERESESERPKQEETGRGCLIWEWEREKRDLFVHGMDRVESCCVLQLIFSPPPLYHSHSHESTSKTISSQFNSSKVK